MRLRESTALAAAIAFVLAASLACKPRGFGAADAGPTPTTTTTATTATTLAGKEPKMADDGEDDGEEEDDLADNTAAMKPTATATATARPTATATAKPTVNQANAPCPGPGITRRCGGVCVNLQTDDRNCGSCGSVCSGGKHCDGHMSCRDANGNL